MRYLVLPFLVVLGLVEFALRATAMLLFILATFCVLWLVAFDGNETQAWDFLKPVSFKLAEKIVA